MCIIANGKIWYDTAGKPIQAHGGSIFYENDTFYWYGENKEYTTGKEDVWTWGIKYYSSKDLLKWNDEGYLLEPELTDKSSVLYPERRLDRPHIVYNKLTSKYVMWVKLSGKDASYLIFTADKFAGPYSLKKSDFRPFGMHCGDFDIAVDEQSGDGYLYFESNHCDVLGCKLREDYLDVVESYIKIYESVKPPYAREGIAHLERNGKHYLFTSGMTGYIPNPSEVIVSDSFLGKYSVLGNPHINDGSCSSFNSQISSIFKHPKKEDLYIALADRWVPYYTVTEERYKKLERAILSHYDKSVIATDSDKDEVRNSPMLEKANTSLALYVWLPVKFKKDIPQIEWYGEWTV